MDELETVRKHRARRVLFEAAQIQPEDEGDPVADRERIGLHSLVREDRQQRLERCETLRQGSGRVLR